jgi:hypothetical protein
MSMLSLCFISSAQPTWNFGRLSSGSPEFRTKNISTCIKSMTPESQPYHSHWREKAILPFLSPNEVGTLDLVFGAQYWAYTFPCLHLTWPFRMSAHDSGSCRIANPYQIAGFHRQSFPIYLGAPGVLHCSTFTHPWARTAYVHVGIGSSFLLRTSTFDCSNAGTHAIAKDSGRWANKH